MAENSSCLGDPTTSKIRILVCDHTMKDELTRGSEGWIRVPDGCRLETIEEASRSTLDDCQVVMIVGCYRQGYPLPKIPRDLVDTLWSFAEGGGIIYAEMVDTSEYPSSRLFGFQQNFAPAQEYLKKLRVSGSQPKVGRLLQWNGLYVPGFAIDSEVLLAKGEFRETHFSQTEGGFPVLLRRKLGLGMAYYAAIPIFSGAKQWMYRPYGAWTAFFQELEVEGLPFELGEFPLQVAREPRSASEAIREGFRWFLDSGILPEDTGEKGIYENVHSDHGGLKKDFRPDCHVQAALAFYLYGEYSGNKAWTRRSLNLLDFIITHGFQDEDPGSSTFGFWKWFDYPGKHPQQVFTDDNSWIAIVLLYIGRKMRNDEYIRRGLLTTEALLRTQSKNGLRVEQLVRGRLEVDSTYFMNADVSFNPHFESIAHAAFLQAYVVSERTEFLETAQLGMTTLRENKERWRWMYSRTAALARYLFPLSLILQVLGDKAVWEDEFYWTINELKRYQDKSYAIEEAENPDPERFGEEDTGVFIGDGEGIADLLYTNNFLLLNLWEGWRATGDREILQFYHELHEFMRKIQITSRYPAFNGAWMRAFDLNAKEYYGNLGDIGWGPYCIESGWTQGIILVGLLAQELDLSLIG